MIRYSVKGKKGRKVAAFLGVTALSVALLAMPVMAKGTAPCDRIKKGQHREKVV